MSDFSTEAASTVQGRSTWCAAGEVFLFAWTKVSKADAGFGWTC